ncbi:hypothetical protein PINS_up011546 [Pythium insidiosum]|nr:hypothetical protein PINS_up011546 [Pythium insidiosum]
MSDENVLYSGGRTLMRIKLADIYIYGRTTIPYYTYAIFPQGNGNVTIARHNQIHISSTTATAMDGLFSPLYAWRDAHRNVNETEVVLNPSAPSSCARLVVKVYRGDDQDDVDVSVRHLAELLRLAELATRPGVDPRVFRDIVAYRDDCLLEQDHCSFCDAVDHHVALKLVPKAARRSSTRQSFTTIVRRAVYDWDEAEASSAFCKLRDWLVARASGEARSRPVELSADINGDADDDEPSRRQEDEVKLLLDCARDERLFRMTTLKVMNPSLKMLRLFASSHLAIQVCGVSRLLKLSDAETDELPQLHLTSLSGNVTMSPDVLYRFLIANSSQLKNVSVNHVEEGEATTMRLIGRSLFAADSPIRLDSLGIEGDIDEQDLKFMIAELKSNTIAGSVSAGDVHHRSFKLATSELSTIRGETLGKLMTLSGGVESLELRCCSGDAFDIAETPSLLLSYPSLRSLDIDTACDSWQSIPLTPVDPSSVLIECLKLRIDERDPSELHNAVKRLLRVVGGSLKTLSIMTTQRSAPLSHEIAAMIAHACPNLEELDFGHIDGDFVSTLMDAYTQQPCKLKRLSFVVSEDDTDLDHLETCLSDETHPLARTLRSLFIDASAKDERFGLLVGPRSQGHTGEESQAARHPAWRTRHLAQRRPRRDVPRWRVVMSVAVISAHASCLECVAPTEYAARGPQEYSYDGGPAYCSLSNARTSQSRRCIGQ